MMRKWIAALALVSAQPALAQDVSGSYFGVLVGTTDYLDLTTLTTDDLSTDNFEANATATRIYGGYRVGGSFGLELGYAETAELSDSVDLGGLIPAIVPVAGEYSTYSVRLMGYLNMKQERLPQVKSYLFLGIGAFDSEFDALAAGAIATIDENSGSMATVGIQIDMPKISLRGEYEWYETGSTMDIWSVGIGIHYRF